MHELRAAWARTLGTAPQAVPWPVRPGPSAPPRTPERQGERGQTLAEYALILALIAVLSIVSLAFLGGTLAELFWDPISAEFGKVLDEIFGP
ncbi:hypothetical protein BH23CHL8_BH23CHL8_24270 [soil metagenome]